MFVDQHFNLRKPWAPDSQRESPRPLSIHTLMAILIVSCFAVAGTDVDYSRDVKPILQKRCFACHGAIKQEARLRLDAGRLILQGGESGPSVHPGQALQSLLVERITSVDPSTRMPPEGDSLSVQEIAKISAWINAGAVTPPGEMIEQDPRQHWSFQLPIRPAVPQVSTGLDESPVDSFLSVKHAQNNIESLPEANKTTLLRRVTIDLIGLPPTRDEMQAFLEDESDDAYEVVVDRLLADPRYGERWGRHWMDVWRYSDWYGRRSVPDVMNSYPQIWRWRDWILQSLNSDKGYDEMIVEMLAADEAKPGDDSSVVATGFLVRNWFKWNYENWMKDNVEHTAKAFLGITMNCCHCHDHKYDPITQEEYFRFRAFFEPLELRQDRVADLADPGPFQKYEYSKSYGPIKAGLIRVFDEKLDAQTFMYVKGDSRNRKADTPPVMPGVPAAMGKEGFRLIPVLLPAEAYYPGLKSFVRNEETAKCEAELNKAKNGLAQAQANLFVAKKNRDQVQAQASPPPVPSKLTEAEQAFLEAKLSLRVGEAHVAWAEAECRSIGLRIAADDAKYRGHGDPKSLALAAFQCEKQADYEKAQWRLAQSERAVVLANNKAVKDAAAKPEVDKAQKELSDSRAAVDAARLVMATVGDSYSPLTPVYPSKTTGRRLALARWIASPKNPLTARVAVNHIWLRHFGRGIVDTPSNFGRNGHSPTHPELLDWLAMELMENNWQMKPLHRSMVTSHAYRARSKLGGPDHPNVARDRDNRWYWRFNSKRMEAEVVRDSILACAEELDTSVGGQEIDYAEGQTSKRRSLYFASHGEGKMPFLDMFDAPDVCDAYERVSSIRPQQALAMTNSELPLVQSRLLAQKIWLRTESIASDADEREIEFVRSAFEQILSRPATEAELQASREFLAEQRSILASAAPIVQTTETAKRLIGPSADATQRSRESFIHALFSHHDFVTVR